MGQPCLWRGSNVRFGSTADIRPAEPKHPLFRYPCQEPVRFRPIAVTKGPI